MHQKTILRSVVSVGSFSFALMALSALTPAHAGFQWVPPESAELSPAPQVVAPAPQAVAPQRAPDFGAPQVIEGTAPAPLAPAPFATPSPKRAAAVAMDDMMEVPAHASAAPASASMSQSNHYLRLPAGAETAPMAAPAAAPAPAAMAPLAPQAPAMVEAPAPVSAPAPTGEKVVRGFAKNVPLAVALRQVLPSEYGFSVDQNVSLGTQVSWQGGAPWRDVLNKMLEPAGLAAQEKDQLIEIVSMRGAAPAAPAGEEKLSAAFDAADVARPAPLQAAAAVPAPVIEPAATPAPVVPKSMGYLKAPASVPSAPEKAHAAPLSVLAAPSAPAPLSLLGSTDSPVVDSWTANRGDTLHDVLKDWAKRANIELTWQAEYDYPLQASVAFGGSFEEAVRALLAGFENATPQPFGTLHKNQVAGQTVLIVQTRGNKYTD